MQPCRPQLILAPMAGYTDYPFRKLAREFGADEVVTELISAMAIVRNNRKTIDMLRLNEDEQPVSIQIFGNDPVVMADAAKIAEGFNPLFIDINMGCPVRKVRKSGSGSALLENKGTAEKIMKGVVDAVKIPVSVKIRTGKNSGCKTGLEIAMMAEDCGVKRVTVHARTADDGFTGPVDYDFVADLRKRIKIELIGNGGITSVSHARCWLERTGCDGLMVGRGAIGRPSIFQAIREDKDFLPKEESVIVMRHIDLVEDFFGPRGVKPMRGHLVQYTKGFDNARSFRKDVLLARTFEELRSVVTQYMESGVETTSAGGV